MPKGHHGEEAKGGVVMKTPIQGQGTTRRSLPKTSQTTPTVQNTTQRCLTGSTAERLNGHVDTGLTQILNMRVGCWQPPMLANVTR